MKIRMQRFGETGWAFQVSLNGIYFKRFRTDEQGDGLWRDVPWPHYRVALADGPEQIRDADQFSLPEDRRKAYAAVRYRFSREQRDIEDAKRDAIIADVADALKTEE